VVVRITWLPGEDVAPATLVRLVGELTGPVQGVRIVRACRACGSDRHGKPQVVVPAGSPAVHVSLSRSGGRAVVAITDAGPVGVDLERLGTEDTDELVAWVRAESLVKATGHGLTIDPDTIDVPHRTLDLDAPDGFVAAVTILTDGRPSVTSITSVTTE
jgi:4'-phosphopantetheinyl transferase